MTTWIIIFMKIILKDSTNSWIFPQHKILILKHPLMLHMTLPRKRKHTIREKLGKSCVLEMVKLFVTCIKGRKLNHTFVKRQSSEISFCCNFLFWSTWHLISSFNVQRLNSWQCFVYIYHPMLVIREKFLLLWDPFGNLECQVLSLKWCTVSFQRNWKKNLGTLSRWIIYSAWPYIWFCSRMNEWISLCYTKSLLFISAGTGMSDSGSNSKGSLVYYFEIYWLYRCPGNKILHFQRGFAKKLNQ